jgi:hypothetical protein
MTMAKAYRKAAPKRASRTNQDHGGIPQLAARISGRSLSMCYKVAKGQAKSAVVQRAIDEAERQLSKGHAA